MVTYMYTHKHTHTRIIVCTSFSTKTKTTKYPPTRLGTLGRMNQGRQV